MSADHPLRRTDLDNGVRVLSERMESTRSVSLGIWIDNGSRDEGDGQHGLSHFLEHMLFKGTRRMSAREIAEAFDFVGADINAATGREHTSVYSRVLSEHLPRAVDIALDMTCSSLLDEGELDSERQVVLEEIGMHNDSPDELVHDHLATSLWGEHPIGHSVLGDSEVIRSIGRDDLMRFYYERYVASRTVVVAAGDVEHESLCELIRAGTDGLERGEALRRDDSIEALARAVTVTRDTEQAHVALGSRGLPRKHPDRFALSVLDNIIGGSMSSRLFQGIRERLGLVYSIYSFIGLFLGMGMVGLYFGTHPGQAQKVIELVEDELVALRDVGIDPLELDRAKNHLKGALLISSEDSGTRMNRISKAELASGEHLRVDELVWRIEQVTVDDLQRVFGETWGSNGTSLAVIGPFDGEAAPRLSGRI